MTLFILKNDFLFHSCLIQRETFGGKRTLSLIDLISKFIDKKIRGDLLIGERCDFSGPLKKISILKNVQWPCEQSEDACSVASSVNLVRWYPSKRILVRDF